MKHPFQLILSDKSGEHLFTSAKHHIQVFSTATGAIVGSWVDTVDIMEPLKKQQLKKIRALEAQHARDIKEAEAAAAAEPDAKKQKIEVKPIRIPKIPTPGPGAPPVYNFIRVLHLTADEKYLVGTTDSDKAIIMFELDFSQDNCLRLVKRQCLAKRPCAIASSEDSSQMIVGDKFGDVYNIGVTTPAVEDLKTFPQPILGHVSMLSDVVYAKHDGKEYVLTADRDEHVRVSHFPKSYVIKKWLFGHKEFVTNMLIPSWAPERLVTSGGDDFICSWDWTAETNNLLDTFSVRDLVLPFLSDYHIAPERFWTEEEAADRSLLEREITIQKILAVEKYKLLVVLAENTNALFVLNLADDGKITYNQTLTTDSQIITFSVDANARMYVGLDNKDGHLLDVYQFQSASDVEKLASTTMDQIAANSVVEVEKADDIYPLYHAAALRKRSEFS
ncbi:hypothetical protein BABINDRAFT_178525 [Babjeviella inositovora NRRL Y-12698]|uniref:Uncharacterized protein n=1 Tax=Babjeviella inositovora NRRL Y-12698 TaxID=984486 RepID=A0A1E3QGV7_9ASCO|nr:uncharacterized protein BABINDRAFT_178525 [Babjeviella inositovora NRRL Y-12698]ODQ76926.1 hypothetical protein BABINDRAFT_178525 [Babjeviella inositovora NRRL Y-12698]